MINSVCKGGDVNDDKLKKNFCYLGTVNGKNCSFRVDTDSDVSILNEKLVKVSEKN